MKTPFKKIIECLNSLKRISLAGSQLRELVMALAQNSRDFLYEEATMASKEKVIHKKHVREKVRKIFEAAQEQYGHQRLLEKCRKLHKKCGVNDNLFMQEFIAAMRYVFLYQEKISVENILNFISKYTVLSYNPSNDQSVSDSTMDECAPFVNSVLEFLFKSHGASSNDARLRCMQLLSKILSGMPENSLISDEIWQKLKETVLCRLQDKNLAVRVQTVLTARMLQDPKSAKCEVIKALIFHFNDPSPAVRRAVVSSIALNKTTISHVLARTRDVNDNVRRNAYLIFSKIKAVNLTIKFRVTILDRGLQDRSEMVRKCVEQILVVNWLENFNTDLIKFLESLDVVNCGVIAIKTVEALLKSQPKEEIVKQLPINDAHLIPKEKMTPETALLWRCLAHHFWEKGDDDSLDEILPSLTVLCHHIREFFKLEESTNSMLNEEEQWAEVKEKEILMHLLQLIKVFDLSDEMGRLKLKKLIIDMLISPRISNEQVKFLIELLVPVIPNKDSFIQELTEVISEIREPMRTVVCQISQREKMEIDLKISDIKVALNELREREYEAVTSKNYGAAEKLKNEIEAKEAELKEVTDQPVAIIQEISEEKNDPITLCKCLSILVEMVRRSDVKVLTPSLLNLKENFLHQCMASRDLLTQSLAIEACAQFCILNKELAKENLIRFLLMISEDGDNEINIPSLKAVFDIILTHGVECFEQLARNTECGEENIPTKSWGVATKNRSVPEDSPLCEKSFESFSEATFLKNLNALLFCKTNDALKAVAYEGLCKLLLSGLIYSPTVLSRIVIKGFSPIIDCEHEDFIRQTFMVFFPIFASNTPRSQEMIEAAFLPVLKTLSQTALGSPDADINPKDVIAFLIHHTKPNINKSTAKALHVHNSLALFLCQEIYREVCDPKDSTYLTHIYIRSLSQLDLYLDSEPFVHQLNTWINKLEQNLKETACLRSLCLFNKKIKEKLQSRNLVSSVENTLSTTRETRVTKRATNQDLTSVLSASAAASESGVLAASAKRSATTSRTSEMPGETLSESSDSCSSPAVPSQVVVPESPEVSD